MKKIMSLVLVMMLCAMLVVPAMAEGDFNIVVNLKTLSSEYWQTVKSGIDQAAEELGLTIDVQGPPSEADIAGQVNQIETQLGQGPDAIIIAPDDNDAVIGALGDYEGVAAVIDKDRASAKLALDLKADMLVILTAVEKVSINYRTPEQRDLDRLTVAQAHEYIAQGHFAPGSMLPKVEAAMKFVRRYPSKKAIITSLDKAVEALAGDTGTTITFN